MRAVCIESNPDGGTALVLRDVDEPSIGPDDVRVAVRASTLNRADLRRASAHFASSQGTVGPAIGGLEMAGEVVEVGANVRALGVGDRVMAMTGGAWAEQVTLDHRLALPVPAGFGWHQAAATPISFITAFDALRNAARLQADETVLVQGGTSAAGLATVQMARALGARQVFATSTSQWKRDALSDLGCRALDPTEDVPAAVRAATDGNGAHVVIDIVGAGAVQQNIDAAAVRGRIVCLGRLAGTEGTFNLDEFSRKRLTMIGVTFRTRSLTERFAVVEQFAATALPLLAADVMRPVIDRSFPLDQVLAAEEYMKSNHGFGKLIIDLGQD